MTTKRVIIPQKELATLGMTGGSHVNGWGDAVRPLAVARGVPEEFLSIGSTKVRCEWLMGGGLAIEWDGP